MTATTNAARQAALRARRAAEGRTEVRGIYARPKHHAAIKAYAERLAANDKTQRRSQPAD